MHQSFSLDDSGMFVHTANERDRNIDYEHHKSIFCIELYQCTIHVPTDFFIDVKIASVHGIAMPQATDLFVTTAKHQNKDRVSETSSVESSSGLEQTADPLTTCMNDQWNDTVSQFTTLTLYVPSQEQKDGKPGIPDMKQEDVHVTDTVSSEQATYRLALDQQEVEATIATAVSPVVLSTRIPTKGTLHGTPLSTKTAMPPLKQDVQIVYNETEQQDNKLSPISQFSNYFTGVQGQGKT